MVGCVQSTTIKNEIDAMDELTDKNAMTLDSFNKWFKKVITRATE